MVPVKTMNVSRMAEDQKTTEDIRKKHDTL